MACGSAWNAIATARAMADAAAAYIAALRLFTAIPARKIAPAAGELIKNTWEMPLSQYVTNAGIEVSSENEKWLSSSGAGSASGVKPCMVLAASKNIHVSMTNGNVNEFMPLDSMTRFIAVRVHVESMEQNISVAHIPHVLERNVGKAHPTRMPLNPHKPCGPESSFRSVMIPASVAEINPITAPHATCGIRHSQAP